MPDTSVIRAVAASAALLTLVAPPGAAYQVVHDAAGNTLFQGPATLDSDGDGVPDLLDPFPFDPLQWADHDRDGIGDGADPDDDGDGIPDAFELSHGLSSLDASDALLDSDGDGYTNLDEYRFGTAPDDPSSSPRIARDDFDGDGRSDLLWWNAVTGEVRIWLMDGVNVTARVVVGARGAQWRLAGTGDVDADRRTDIVWRNDTSGDVEFWHMQGGVIAARTAAGSLPGIWTLAGTGDFNRDMRSDLFWRDDATGENRVWLTGPDGVNAVEPGAGSEPGQRLAGIADFTGDGRDDVHWYDASTRANTLWVSNALDGDFDATPTVYGDPGWTPAGSGPMSGDPYADMLWYQGGTGRLIYLRMNGAAYLGYWQLGYTWDTRWRPVQLADLDAAGGARIVWRHSHTGQVSVWRIQGGYVRQKAAYGDLPDAAWAIVPTIAP